MAERHEKVQVYLVIINFILLGYTVLLMVASGEYLESLEVQWAILFYGCAVRYVHSMFSFTSKRVQNLHLLFAVCYFVPTFQFCVDVAFGSYSFSEDEFVLYCLITSNYYLIVIFHFIAYFLGWFVKAPEEDLESVRYFTAATNGGVVLL